MCTLCTYIQEWAIAEQKKIEEKQEHSKPKEGTSWILVWRLGLPTSTNNFHVTFDPRICILFLPHTHTLTHYTLLSYSHTTSHAHTHTHSYTHTHTRTRTHILTHTHTHTQFSAKPESTMTVDASETLRKLAHHQSPLEIPVSL